MQTHFRMPYSMPRWQAPCLALGLHVLVLAVVVGAASRGHEVPGHRSIPAMLVSGPVTQAAAASPAPQATIARRVVAHSRPQLIHSAATRLVPPLRVDVVPAQMAFAPAPATPSPTTTTVLNPVAVAPVNNTAGVAETAGGARIAEASPASGVGTDPASTGKISYDASYRHKPVPDYPWQARHMNEEGEARVAVQVGSNGHAVAVRLIKSSGFGALDQAAQMALKNCDDCFVPPSRDGKSVPGWVLVPMDFRLDG